MAQKKPLTVKEHANAAHVRGELSLLQRKLASTLLYHAYPLLPVQDGYEIKLSHLCDLIGFESHNLEPLKDALRGLSNAAIEWGARKQTGGLEVWGVSSMLANAQIDAQSGVCGYSYGALLREKLYNPDLYAALNLDMQRKFGSRYALALYENCVRYREAGTTEWMAIEALRQWLGCDSQATYGAFKRLSNQVIKPAVQEVNETSDIELTPEYKRQSRKVESVRIKVKDKRELPPLRTKRLKAGPAESEARVQAMVEAVADHEKEAQTKVQAEQAFRDMKVILGRTPEGH